MRSMIGNKNVCNEWAQLRNRIMDFYQVTNAFLLREGLTGALIA